MTPDPSRDVAIVVIGRNEGERLKSCLRSAMRYVGTVVYVDSGSADGSPQYVRATGCPVVELDAAQPFSAARGRNEGFACVMRHAPESRFIQFLDGDCDLVEGWIERGAATLREREDVGIVCGQVRELYPHASVYNKLFDLEWRQPAGEIRSSGGNFMIRTQIFRAVGGFRPEVIAAEDDEFCVRVRRLGSKILQMDAPMVRHDMAMMHFSEWWRRTKRTGHAFAQVAALHGASEERYFVSDCRRIWIWGLLLPAVALVLAPFTHGLSLLILGCAYALQFARTFSRSRKRGWRPGEAFLYSAFTMFFKFPALCGLCEYHWRQWRGRGFTIMEFRRSKSITGSHP